MDVVIEKPLCSWASAIADTTLALSLLIWVNFKEISWGDQKCAEQSCAVCWKGSNEKLHVGINYLQSREKLEKLLLKFLPFLLTLKRVLCWVVFLVSSNKALLW